MPITLEAVFYPFLQRKQSSALHYGQQKPREMVISRYAEAALTAS